MQIFRSAREAVGSLTEETLPGDFVRVLSSDPNTLVFGRVLDPADPGLDQQVPSGRVPVMLGEGNIQQFDPADIEKINAAELPSELLSVLSGQGEDLQTEVLADLDPELAEEFGLADRPDPERSMANKLAQRMPDVRNRKSRAMKRNWRRSKGRSGDRKLGNEPALMRMNPQHTTFESLVEQVSQGFGAYGVNSDVMAGTPGNMGGGASDEEEILGQENVTFEGSNAMNPEVAFNLTTRVFEASNDIMKSLSLSNGMPYFTWLQDDPEEGIVRIKINGVCPKEIVEKFTRNLKDLEIVELEHPEGSHENNDLVGSWVFETQLPGFPEFEEPNYEPEEPQYGQTGEAPGEIVIPEQPVAGMG